MHKHGSKVAVSVAGHKLWWTPSLLKSGCDRVASDGDDAGAMTAAVFARIYGGHLIDAQWLALCTLVTEACFSSSALRSL